MTVPTQPWPSPLGAAPTLHHVMVVGGTVAEWADMQLDDWEKRVDELGSYCASIGVPWLTVRVYRDDDRTDRPASRPRAGTTSAGAASRSIRRATAAGGSPTAMNALDATVEVTEATVNAALYGAADSEPDLLVVLGPPTQLPASLVWSWRTPSWSSSRSPGASFGAGDLAAAVVDFAGRRRRFGGLDDE